MGHTTCSPVLPFPRLVHTLIDSSSRTFYIRIFLGLFTITCILSRGVQRDHETHETRRRGSKQLLSAPYSHVRTRRGCLLTGATTVTPFRRRGSRLSIFHRHTEEDGNDRCPTYAVLVLFVGDEASGPRSTNGVAVARYPTSSS